MKTNSSCASVLAATMIAHAAPPSGTFRVYLGTQAEGDKRGIYMTLLDTETGQLGRPVRVSDSVRPGFIAIHPDGQHLYATDASESFSGEKGEVVSAYQMEEPAGTLRDLNTQPSGGLGPCHLSIDPTGKSLLVANYRGGSCAALPIRLDGTLGEPTAIRQHTGSSAHPSRQTAAHTHSINCDPDGRFALVADLGTDQILIYRLDAATGTLTPSDPPFIRTKPGSGPRHLTFDPAGNFVYACMELSNEVSVYEYNAADGILTEIQTLSTLPEEFDGYNLTSEVLTSKDGRFLYVGNRGHESIAIFAIDPNSGTLTPVGHEPTRGEHPRNFNIDPTGQFLVVANAHTDNVVVFKIDPKTGQLKFTGSEVEVPSATCVRFLASPK